MNKNKKQKKIVTLLFGMMLLVSGNIHTETKFELKKTEPKETPSDKPLFELLSNEIPQLKTGAQIDNKWGNNPFFTQQPTIKAPEIKIEPEAPQTLDLYEYKISAIWKVNEEYKALISGHIVKNKDKVNEVTIEKITEKDVLVSRKKKKRTFRLGSVFYDFQI